MWKKRRIRKLTICTSFNYLQLQLQLQYCITTFAILQHNICNIATQHLQYLQYNILQSFLVLNALANVTVVAIIIICVLVHSIMVVCLIL